MDQVKTLGKHRGSGAHKMIIEHVNVESRGQAIVGQVEKRSKRKNKNDA